ncbi:hypothetical protein NE237_019284 [Protea cynaroides]|uniref:Glycosyltransferase n=1 Tax=Protea cynaroides TaxID=273540 RepID=A0A9Q0QPQ5_9MAGN|nr:hypothetical protein NE237_019284 [Protea cynaroides]
MDSVGVLKEKKPHVVCIPAPAQGHISPMLKLAKLLYHRGFHITFVNTEFNHKRLINSRGADSLQGLPDFQFHTIPDGLPPSDTDSTQDIRAICQATSLKGSCLVPFRNLLSKLNTTDINPVTCIVSDGVMSFTSQAAEEIGVPEVVFWTVSACAYLAYIHIPHLMERGLTPLKDASNLSNGYLDTPLDWIPSMTGIRLRDMPSFVRTTDPDDFLLDFIKEVVGRTYNASAIILNTFDSLEEDAVKELSRMLPRVYTLGPLHRLLDQIKNDSLKFIDSNLWKEESGCLEWLDSKEPCSVVYVNFGSITVMAPQQLVEFAWGLANSEQTFLFIIRPDLVRGDSAILPFEFVKQTKERGMLARWCPQGQVLSHPAIGGFLTHCGWNSTLESICSGVPMVCWPFFADQQTNCRYSCNHWGIGTEIDNNVKRDEVERLVRELMEGDKGKEMKSKAMMWKKKAEEATTSPVGSSFLNLDNMVSQILLFSRN